MYYYYYPECLLRLTRDIIVRPTPTSICKPLIRIPTCKRRCTISTTQKLFNVPVKCQREDRQMDIVVPTDCNCRC